MPDSVNIAWRTSTGEERTIVASVEAVVGEETTVRIPEAIPAGETVWMYDGKAVRTTSVRSCEAQTKGFVVRLGLQRRREEREPAGGMVVLNWSDSKGPQTAEAQVRDICSTGMQVQVLVPVEVDRTVRLEGETFQCIGVARYCRRQGGRFLVGIEFTRPPYDKESPEFRD